MDEEKVIKTYQVTKELAEYKFEHEGEMVSLESIITDKGGWSDFLTWAITGKIPNYAEVRSEIGRSNRANSARENQNAKGRAGRNYPRNSNTIS